MNGLGIEIVSSGAVVRIVLQTYYVIRVLDLWSWVWCPVREFRLAVLVYRCLHGSAPGYLASDLQRVSHLNARWRLRSSTTALVAPHTAFYHWRPHLSSDCCISLE